MEGDGKPTNNSQSTSDGSPIEPSVDKKPVNASFHKSNGSREQKHPLEWFIGILLLFTLIATSVAACYTRRQWITAEDNEKRSLRAYIIVTDFGVFCPDCGETVLTPNARSDIRNSIRSRIENSGQTPASEVVGITNWWPGDTSGHITDLPQDFAFPDHVRTGFVSKSDIGRDKHKDTAEEMDIAAVATFKNAAAGNTALFLYGHVDYCDIFGEAHTTAFCFKYVPNAGVNLPLCDRYNGEIAPKSTCENQGSNRKNSN